MPVDQPNKISRQPLLWCVLCEKAVTPWIGMHGWHVHLFQVEFVVRLPDDSKTTLPDFLETNIMPQRRQTLCNIAKKNLKQFLLIVKSKFRRFLGQHKEGFCHSAHRVFRCHVNLQSSMMPLMFWTPPCKELVSCKKSERRNLIARWNTSFFQ